MIAKIRTVTKQYRGSLLGLGVALALIIAPITGGALAQSGRGPISIENAEQIDVLDVISTLPAQSKNRYTRVAFSPDGGLLAVGDSEGIVYLWNLTTNTAEVTLQSPAQILSLAFSPDSKRLVAASSVKQGSDAVYIWDVETGAELFHLNYPTRINSVAFSPDGNLIATGSVGSRDNPDNSVRFWDSATGKEVTVFEEYEAGVNTISFSPDGTLLASGSSNSVRLLDATTGDLSSVLEYERPLPENGRPMPGSWSGLGKLRGGVFSISLTVSEDGTQITGVGLVSGGSFISSSGKSNITGKGFSWFLSAGGTNTYTIDGTFSSQIKASGTISGGGTWATTPSIPLVSALAFTSDGKMLASGTGDNAIQIWDITSGNLAKVLKDEGKIADLAFSSDGGVLISANRKGHLRLWNAASGEILYEQKDKFTGISSLSLSPDGTLLAAAGSSSAGPLLLLWGVSAE